MGISRWLQKLAFFSSLKIRTRIALLAIIPIAGLLILTATYFVGERTIGVELDAVRANTKLAELSTGVHKSALQLRRHEKDFLLNKDKKLVELHRAETLEVLKLLDAVQASSVAGEVRDQTGQLREQITAYAGQFDMVVGLQQELGLDQASGLQGALQKSVLDVEAKLDAFNFDTLTANGSFNADELIVKMLMMRRHEKDFILWGLEKYLDEHAKRRQEFDLLMKLSAISDGDKAEINKLMDAYQRDFGAWAKVELELRQQASKLSERFAEMEPVFGSIDTIAQQAKAKANAALTNAQKRTRSAWIATVVLLLSAVLLFTIAVARGISRPLERITAETMRLAEGDLEVEILDRNRKDEIGDLASALQVFKENGVEKDRLEHEKQETEAEAERTRAEELVRVTIFQSEIDDTVQAAAKGDLSRRLKADSADGVMHQLGEGMNRLLTVVERGLSETIGVVSALAQGDLSRKIEGDYDGSFLTLKEDVNRMTDQLREIAGQIVTSSVSVDGATSEIAAGVADLSTRTEHQASSLEETTASMEELSTTVRQNADNAQEANQVAVAARLSAANGGEVVDEVVNAMSRIEGSSKKIADIVGLIQEIAFQTNLLALNAAVEAARAGDAGKGFAVVANEVRALAQRSAQASKDIKELIATSDSEVRDGVELVNRAGDSLGEILTSVKKVADFVSEIATASQEQSAGIDQVSRAINSMEEMTQQNGALVEETTAALQSAQSQVGDLREVVSFFKTGEAATDAAPVVAAAKDEPGINPVHKQHKALAKKVGGGNAIAEVDADWQAF